MEDMIPSSADDALKVNTFENVWTALMELRKTVAETSKVAAETSKVAAETSKIIANLSKNIGGLGNMQGRLTEAMFEPELCQKFYEIGFSFDSQIARKVFKENGQFVAEADFFLENGEYAMPVEVKTEFSVRDVDEHTERLAKIREYMDARNDKRKLVGAVAGEIVAENVLNYAQKKGLYVLKQSGDSVAIAAAPRNFKQQEW